MSCSETYCASIANEWVILGLRGGEQKKKSRNKRSSCGWLAMHHIEADVGADKLVLRLDIIVGSFSYRSPSIPILEINGIQNQRAIKNVS